MKRMTERCDGCGKIPGAIGGPVLDRLCEIEDALGEEYDLARVQELMEAEREGRIKIYEKREGNVCGTCGHFKQIQGKRRGTCDIRKWPKDKWGCEYKNWGRFEPNWTRTACKEWIRRKEQEKKEGRKP